MLTERFNQDHVARINFKDPLLDLAREIGWNGKKDEKGRKFLQLLGTDCVRECIDYDYWTKKWSKGVEDYSKIQEIDLIIADDIRFENEARAIKEFDGLIVHLDTPSQNHGPDDTHQSEAGIDPKYFDKQYSLKFGLNYIQEAVDDFYWSFLKGQTQGRMNRKQILGG